ncbi:MAG: C-terminal helicase domain-containing protein, partial [Patescibacteria group bacterium]
RGSVLVFLRTKFGAKKIAAGLRTLGYSSAELHSNRSLNQRKEALEGFRNGRYRILVATDIAARGIDVKGIELVLNYDLPQAPEDYVHRIGRTARAGGAGHAISFATPDQKNDVRDIERLIRATLPLSELPKDMPVSQMPMPSRPSFHSHGRQPRFGGTRGRSSRPGAHSGFQKPRRFNRSR